MTGQMKEIDVLIRARYSLIYVVSWEERRVLAVLKEIVVGQDKQFYTWSETLGLRAATKQITTGGADNRTLDPLNVLGRDSDQRRSRGLRAQRFPRLPLPPVPARLRDSAQACAIWRKRCRPPIPRSSCFPR